MIPGDGIGPEISASVQKIFQAAGVSYEQYNYKACQVKKT